MRWNLRLSTVCRVTGVLLFLAGVALVVFLLATGRVSEKPPAAFSAVLVVCSVALLFLGNYCEGRRYRKVQQMHEDRAAQAYWEVRQEYGEVAFLALLKRGNGLLITVMAGQPLPDDFHEERQGYEAKRREFLDVLHEAYRRNEVNTNECLLFQMFLTKYFPTDEEFKKALRENRQASLA